MMIPLVDLKAEYTEFSSEIDAALKRVASSGRYILGPEVDSLEEKLATYAQVDAHARTLHCVGVSDGTTALQIALMALGIGAGDEVVVPPFTWIGTVDVVSVVGATVVFCDVDKDGHIDVLKLASVVTPRTRAVIAVSLFGLVAPLSALRAALDSVESVHWTRIALIEDAAQSFGASSATRCGDTARSCGSPYATISTTSFFPTKPLGGLGDGGALFSTDEKLVALAREIRRHGRRPSDGKFVRQGLNSRLDALHAAVLSAKLERLEYTLRRRRDAAARYHTLLQSETRIIPMHTNIDKDNVHVWAIFNVRVRERDAVMRGLKERGVSAAVYYGVCCHQQPMYATSHKDVRMPVAEALSSQVLALPLDPWIIEETQQKVVNALIECLDELDVTQPPDNVVPSSVTPA